MNWIVESFPIYERFFLSILICGVLHFNINTTTCDSLLGWKQITYLASVAEMLPGFSRNKTVLLFPGVWALSFLPAGNAAHKVNVYDRKIAELTYKLVCILVWEPDQSSEY